jgi:methionyl-tRNA formyltransferase
MRIVFMGSPDFAVPSLEALAGSFHVVGVVTQPDRPAGRGRETSLPAVKQTALAHSIPIIQPKSLRNGDSADRIEAWEPDVIVVAAFGQILPEAVLGIPPSGCVNVHASLLPRWRGAAPIQAAILHGDRETGVTIMRMDAGLDTGPIIAQERIPILDDDTAESIFTRLSQLAASLLVDVLPGYVAGRIQPIPQDNGRATYAPTLKKGEGRLLFAAPAEQLARQVRAYHPWPGTHFFWAGQRIKVLAARPHPAQDGSPIGATSVVEGLPAVQTGKGMLILERVQPAGRRPMDGRSFLNGARSFATGRVDPPPSPELPTE